MMLKRGLFMISAFYIRYLTCSPYRNLLHRENLFDVKVRETKNLNTVKRTKLTAAICNILRFCPLAYFSTVLFLDLFDWFLHSQSLANVNASDNRGSRQSQVITQLAFLRSQFSMAVAVMVNIYFVRSSEQIAVCYRLCQALRKLIPPENADGSSGATMIFVCGAINLLFITSTLRLVYYCYSTSSDAKAFWEITEYFIFSLPAGLVILIIQITVILCELSLLPAYAMIAEFCIVFSQHVAVVNGRLKFISDQLWTTSPLSAAVFDDLLRPLLQLDKKLSDFLDQLDCLLSSLLGVLVCGNTVLLTSITAQGFISATLAAPIYLALFSCSISSPLIALVLLMSLSTLVHEAATESRKRWTALVLSRQYNREKGYRCYQSEGERLMSVLISTTNAKHSLSVLGAVHAHRSFGVTLAAGFVGFICFLIERAEHFAHSNYIAEYFFLNNTKLFVNHG